MLTTHHDSQKLHSHRADIGITAAADAVAGTREGRRSADGRIAGGDRLRGVVVRGVRDAVVAGVGAGFRLDEAEMRETPHDQLSAGLHVHFFVDVGEVEFHRFFGHEQLIRDFLVRQAFGNEFRDFGLTIRQTFLNQDISEHPCSSC